MKAAILYQIGTTPLCGDVAEPTVSNNQQLVVNIKASSIKQLDLQKAAGKHYTSYESLPVIMGMDGVATLENGQRIYAMGLTGMMAEKAIVQKNKWIPIPDGLDDSTAAALPNALVGSDIALRSRGNIKKGDIVLVNGATGSTGMLAVQMAKYHQAAAIIATGRNAKVLERLKELGADRTISLDRPDDEILADFQHAYRQYPFDIVVDYLWGKPAELLLAALIKIPSEKKTKFITVGEMAGETIHLPSSTLRSRNVVLLGSGIGSFSPQIIADYLQHSLPEIFQYASLGNLFIDTTTFPLTDIANVWHSKGNVVIQI